MRLKDTKEADIGEVDPINYMALKRPDLQNTHLLSPRKVQIQSERFVEWLTPRSELWHNRNMLGPCPVYSRGCWSPCEPSAPSSFFTSFSMLCDSISYWSLSREMDKVKRNPNLICCYVWKYKTNKTEHREFESTTKTLVNFYGCSIIVHQKHINFLSLKHCHPLF